MTTLRERIAWISARLFGALRPAAEPDLRDLAPRDGDVNGATAYGVQVIVAQPPADTQYWRVTRVHHLLPEENHGNHHIYLDVLDEAGNRLPDARVRVMWDGGVEEVTMNKPPGEPAANFPMWKYQICDVIALGASGEAMPSDRVANLHTGHPDEAPGNTLFHHSFAVVFQRTVAGLPLLGAASVAEGHLLNGAGLVVLLRKTGATVAQQTVGIDESFRFADLAAGSYVVVVQGRDVQSAPFTLDGQNRMVIELAVPPPDDGKGLAHYLLFAPLDGVPASVDWLVAVPYLQAFGLTAGTQQDHARLARRVTIIGSGPHAVPETTEQALIAAGCRVERIGGSSDDIEAELARRTTLGRP